MANVFFILAMVCLFAVLGTLIFGVFVMAKEGEENRRKSNKFMRLRVTLQALTIVFLFLAYAAR